MDERNGQADLQSLFETRRRIIAAFEDIAAGTEAIVVGAARADPAPDPEETQRLRAEVEEERIANAQLEERVRALRDRQDGRVAALEDHLAQARARIEGLEAERDASRDEIESVLIELIPLIEEAR